MIGKAGTTKKPGKRRPIPTYAGKVTRRAESRARIVLDSERDFAAAIGVLLIVQADFADGFEVVAADVYAVHPEFRMVDVRLRAPLPAETSVVKVYRTSLGDGVMGMKAVNTKSDARAGSNGHAIRKHAPLAAEQQQAITKLSDATRMLAQIKDAPTAKKAIDLATAAEFYARKARLGEEAIAHATIIKLSAKRMLGRHIDRLPEAKRGPKPEAELISGGNNKSRLEAYEEIGITPKIAAEAQRYADVSDEEWALVEAGEIKPSVALRNQKRATLGSRVAALPADKHRVIYADPPWKYGDERAGLEKEGTAAAAQYPTMPTVDICALDIKSIAADDAVLFMWATFPLLEDGLDVIKAWGFKYKTAYVWDKQRSNIGNYHDARAELLMIATRGSCPIEIDTRPKQVQSIARGKHSAKPEEFRALIDQLYPTGPRIELFRRGEAPKGWKIWGNESEAAA